MILLLDVFRGLKKTSVLTEEVVAQVLLPEDSARVSLRLRWTETDVDSTQCCCPANGRTGTATIYSNTKGIM